MDFQVPHTLYIDEELAHGFKIHTISTFSMAASVSFADTLIIFVSETYKEYILEKFSLM